MKPRVPPGTAALAATSAVLLVFFVLPVAVFLAHSLFVYVQPGEVRATLTDENLVRLLADGYVRDVIVVTFRIALSVTAVCVVLGYPLAHFIARETGAWRSAVLLVVTASLFTNLIVRTYGWIVLLTPRGILNTALIDAGLVERPLRLMFNEFAVVVGLAQIMLPIFILVAAVAISAIPRTLEDAAAVAGAGPVRTFLRVTLPLGLPGVVNGAVLVFVLSVSNFITPDFLGGGRILMIGSMIHQLVTRTLNYPFAATVALALLAVAVLVLVSVSLGRIVLGALTGRHRPGSVEAAR